MPVLDRIFPNLVLQFVKQQLFANIDWISIHEERLYEDVRFPTKPEFPVGVITSATPSKIWLWTGSRREYIGKMRSQIRIYSVRQYENGAGTWMDFNDSFHALREALTGIGCLDVTYFGKSVGTVFQSRYLSTVQFVVQDDDVDTLYHGIAIEVIHK